MREVLTMKEFRHMSNEYDKVKFKCKCGHRVIIPAWVKKQLCDWCGDYVYRDKKIEFEERIKEKMRRV